MPRVTLKNYRPFADSAPLRIAIEPGFTALVGPNNSGKSSFLRFIYESREIWRPFGERSHIINYANGTPNAEVIGVGDPAEIFHNQNDRPITIAVEFGTARSQALAKVELTLHRPTPGNSPPMSTKVYAHGSDEPLQGLSPVTAAIDGVTVEAVQGRDARIADVRPFSAFATELRDSVYVGPFRNAITEGKASYFDLSIGTSFIAT